MRRAALFCLLLGLFAHSAGAQEASRRFPLEQRFVVNYLNGQDFMSKSLTLTVRRDTGRGFRATGYSGCNTWFARLDLSEADRFAVTDVATTRKMCHRDRMRTEREFLAIVRSVKHWRMDGRMLLLLGDTSTLVLAPASRTAQLN
jgi:heat shock protein HslJ